MHHQFVAAAEVVEYCHRHYPQMKVGSMITRTMVYPYNSDPNNVLAATQTMREVYAFSDIQVRGEYPEFLLAKLKKHILRLNFRKVIRKNYVRIRPILWPSVITPQFVRLVMWKVCG